MDTKPVVAEYPDSWLGLDGNMSKDMSWEYADVSWLTPDCPVFFDCKNTSTLMLRLRAWYLEIQAVVVVSVLVCTPPFREKV